MNQDKDDKEESETFLESKKSSKDDRKAERSFCNKKCQILFCCLIFISLVLLLSGGALVYVMRANSSGVSSKDAELWEKSLSEEKSKFGEHLINGTYQLVSFDEEYKPYLKAIGIPFFIIPLILGSSEQLTFESPSSETMSEGNWSYVNTNDLGETTMSFRLSEDFEILRPKVGILSAHAVLLNNYTLFLTTRDNVKNEKYTSEFIFSSSGIINTRTFVNQNITTKKYYQRLQRQDELLAPSTSSQNSIFSLDENDNFWND